jgi:hypothetical protein
MANQLIAKKVAVIATMKIFFAVDIKTARALGREMLAFLHSTVDEVPLR